MKTQAFEYLRSFPHGGSGVSNKKYKELQVKKKKGQNPFFITSSAFVDLNMFTYTHTQTHRVLSSRASCPAGAVFVREPMRAVAGGCPNGRAAVLHSAALRFLAVL